MKPTYITLTILGLLSGFFLLSCNEDSDRGACEDDSDCKMGRICLDNICQYPYHTDVQDTQTPDVRETMVDTHNDNICRPECEANDCMLCRNGQCVYECGYSEFCEYGTCRPLDSCYPACDPYNCEICLDGECVYFCNSDEICDTGECWSNEGCYPSCTGEMSFCNEIGECAPGDCDGMHCGGADPNMHCAESFGDVGCLCNPGWAWNQNQDGCVQCVDDRTSNTLEDPTPAYIPFEHRGILCTWDVFSFTLEAGSSLLIDLDGFDVNSTDIDIYLLLDDGGENIAARSESANNFEQINYAVQNTQTYYLIVIPYSGPLPAGYHLSINYLYGEMLDYRYARIDDMNPRTGRGAPGADIDAVELRGPYGTKNFATNIVDADILLGDQGDNDMMDPEEALGAPDNDCEVDEKFVALGGIGGFIIVEFGGSIIEVGDQIVVYEVGESCGYDNDPLSLSVSVSNWRDGVWEAIGQADGGKAVFYIEYLTPVYP